MQKIYRTKSVSYVVRLVGDRGKDNSGQVPMPCFMGMQGFALCGILNKGETIDEFNKRVERYEKELSLLWGKK